MLEVPAGQRAQPVRREERAPRRRGASKIRSRCSTLDDAEQERGRRRLADDWPARRSRSSSVRAVEQPREPLADGLRAARAPRSSIDGERGQRQDADHRAHLDRHDDAVGPAQLVVVEAVLLVPEALLLDRLGDQREVLEELEHEVGRPGAPWRFRIDGDRRHAERVRRHPAGRVRLLEHVARGQVRAVDRADVVEPEEAALEDVRAVRVLRLTHQVKLTSSLSKMRLRKSTSRPPSIAKTSSAAQACTGGLTSSNAHS